jgi:DNA-binding NarL/FixJ family response regulator
MTLIERLDRTVPTVRVSPDVWNADPRDNRRMSSGVVLVDDHASYRSLARVLLEREGLEVLGEAHDGDSAVELVERLRPDLVLLDVHLPGDDGFAVAERLAALSSPPVVVLISSRSVRELRHRLANSPAAGFVAKDQLSAAAIAEVLGCG